MLRFRKRSIKIKKEIENVVEGKMLLKKIIFNGPIITMDENLPIAEAVGIEDEKI